MPIEIGILKLIHILCLVYWLGADLGVFYSSYYLVNENFQETHGLMSLKSCSFWIRRREFQ